MSADNFIFMDFLAVKVDGRNAVATVNWCFS